jgi:hypothetical protein
MKLPDGAQLRLSLEWMPPLTCLEPEFQWTHEMGNRIDDAQLGHLFHYNKYEVEGDRIYFYMRTELATPKLKRLLKSDVAWKSFLKRYPDAKLEFAEDIEGAP